MSLMVGNFTEAFVNLTTTTETPIQPPTDTHFKRLRFVLVPLFVLFIVVLMSAVVYLVIRKKKIDKLRHHLVPLYNFDPSERDDWEAELLDESVDSSVKKDYKTMDSPSSNP